ncbi:MAG: hypothetical protein IJF02_01050 [Oscillospiraceae bacterium]|nr:hypothetical protein [Oscillospiraceae bacterium]
MVAPMVLIVLLLLLHMLLCFYSVVFDSDRVKLKWFGMIIREIPVDQFQLFCAVGNGREDVLCLSCYRVEELANMREEQLLRSSLTKHEVPLRKRNPDWQDVFAQEYLNHLRKNPFCFFRERNMVMFSMDSAMQILLRQQYPQLMWRNYTGVTSPYASRFSGMDENRAVCMPLPSGENRFSLEPDGIHLYTQKEETAFFPAQALRTVLRIDVFRGYDKFYPHHMPLLFVTTLSEEALAEYPSAAGYGGFCLGENVDPCLEAVLVATNMAMRWNKNREVCCVVPFTRNNLDTVRRLYPHLSVNELSGNWIKDS